MSSSQQQTRGEIKPGPCCSSPLSLFPNNLRTSKAPSWPSSGGILPVCHARRQTHDKAKSRHFNQSTYIALSFAPTPVVPRSQYGARMVAQTLCLCLRTQEQPGKANTSPSRYSYKVTSSSDIAVVVSTSEAGEYRHERCSRSRRVVVRESILQEPQNTQLMSQDDPRHKPYHRQGARRRRGHKVSPSTT